MTCPKHEEVSAYMDDMLPPPERRQFSAHLDACLICQERMADLATLRQALRELPSPALGFDLAARLQPQIRKRPVPRREGRSFWPAWGVPGLAVALSLASGAWLGAMLIGGGTAVVPSATMARVFDPVPPGGLCAAAELCRSSKGLK